MSDPIKTITFISVALLCAVGAFWSMPTIGELEEGDPAGQLLFPKFTDPLAVASMSITKYDEKKGPVGLDVELVEGAWRIPSHGNYPADALEQVSQAATLFSGMKILNRVSSESGSQEVYGVLDPTQEKLWLGVKGVGTRVVLKNVEGIKLADLIIGEPDPDKPDVRYVRRTGEPMIFAVKMKGNKFTTKFSDWAEKNPLDMNILDLYKVFFEDYRWHTKRKEPFREGRVIVQYDPEAKKEKWTSVGNWIFGKGGTYIPYPPASNQVLNTELLNQLKSTLGDLQIINVVRKPSPLSQHFVEGMPKFSEWKTDSLMAKLYKTMEPFGFYLKEGISGVDLYARQGQISVLLDGGIKYTFRFGNVAAHTKTADSAKADKNQKGAKTKKGEDTGTLTLNRYLLVTAEFDPKEISLDLKELPALPVEGVMVPEVTESYIEKIKTQRARIKRENEFKQQEYNEKVAAGKKRVKELNARFADWYYIIPESVYKKLHLTIDKLYKNKY